jgi:hypothetical protein
VLERLAKPSVVGRVGVLAHERIINGLVAIEYLAMYLALVVIPDLAARLRKYGPDRQQKPHLLRLEDTSLRVYQWDAFTVEHEAWLQLGLGKMVVKLAQPPELLEGSHAHRLVET